MWGDSNLSKTKQLYVSCPDGNGEHVPNSKGIFSQMSLIE